MNGFVRPFRWKGLLCCFLLLLPGLYAQNRSVSPVETLDFATPPPKRLNALDLLATVNGYAMLRYQRAVWPRFSFLLDIHGYFWVANLFHLLGKGRYDAATLNQDLRFGGAVGLAFWPWESLRDGYVALRTHLQIQFLRAKLGAVSFSRERFLVGNSLEIGVRLGKKVVSPGVFGGLGVQVPTDAQSVLPENYSLPILYAYFGLSLGLTL